MEDSKSDLRRLRKERDALQRERNDAEKETDSGGGTDPLALERAKLRGQLTELLKKINERKSAPPPDVHSLPKSVIDDGSKPLDPLNQAQSLYRSGDYEASLRAFRLVDTAALNSEDRSFVQYMIAACLRRLGRLSEAANVYREVADSREDPLVTECAIWQLSNINWRKELEAQIEELKQRRRAK